LRTYGVFCEVNSPFEAHFPVRKEVLGAWAATFQNAGTFRNYVTHLRTASRLLGLDLPDGILTASLGRGLKKITAAPVKSSLSGHTVLRAMRLAADSGHLVEVRLWAVARQFLLRVESELFPLQLNGRLGLDPKDIGWHSVVSVDGDPPRAVLHLRKRKADPQGARIKRECVCKSQHPLLCGVCALRTQVARHRQDGLRPQTPLFHTVDQEKALALLRACLQPTEARVTWHGFRRGMASDLLRSGHSFKEVAKQGGWRSSCWTKYVQEADLAARQDAALVLPSDDE
jgi:hypothetical protein